MNPFQHVINDMGLSKEQQNDNGLVWALCALGAAQHESAVNLATLVSTAQQHLAAEEYTEAADTLSDLSDAISGLTALTYQNQARETLHRLRFLDGTWVGLKLQQLLGSRAR
jgi:hypothetical protein